MMRREDWRNGSWIAIPVWLAITAWGFCCILQYEETAGPASRPALHWPANSSVVRHSGHLNLIVAVHPRCPCTRPAVDELAELMARAPMTIAVQVLIYKPRNCEPGWERTGIARAAAAIPGVVALPDEDGAEAECFGIVSSGHALLYDAGGELVYSGGLTNARGHAGESVGRNAILAIAGDSIPERSSAPVYGCPLFGPLAPSSERCPQCQR